MTSHPPSSRAHCIPDRAAPLRSGVAVSPCWRFQLSTPTNGMYSTSSTRKCSAVRIAYPIQDPQTRKCLYQQRRGERGCTVKLPTMLAFGSASANGFLFVLSPLYSYGHHSIWPLSHTTNNPSSQLGQPSQPLLNHIPPLWRLPDLMGRLLYDIPVFQVPCEVG